MRTLSQKSGSWLSLVLFVFSGLSATGLYMAALANRSSKDGWNQTPLGWMFVLAITPVVCGLFGFVLVRLRRQAAERLRWFDLCSLLLGFFVALFACLWVLMLVMSLAAKGIL